MKGEILLSVDEAREIILNKIDRLSSEEVPILESLGRVLDENVYAEIDLPPFDSSTMDGYAVRSEDTMGAWPAGPIELKALEGIAATCRPEGEIGEGETIRIMAGAPLPEGADAVIMVEYTERIDDRVLIYSPARPGENIRYAGEDVKRGEIALARGKRIALGDIGILAALGKAKVEVVRKPTVAVIAAGDELIDIDMPLSAGKIRNSHSYEIAAQVIDCGCVPLILGVASGGQEALAAKIEEASSADIIIIITSDVSVSDCDLIRVVLNQIGEIIFWQAVMEPGRPLAFGIVDRKPVISLPGAASSIISFEQFARPALLKMSGRTDISRISIEAVFEGESFKNESGCYKMVRVTIEKEGNAFKARLGGLQKSEGLNESLKPMALANGLMVIPENVKEIQAGDKVTVQLFEPIID